MSITHLSVPDILAEFKKIDLNLTIVKIVQGKTSYKGVGMSILRDIYLDNIILNKETVTVCLNNDNSGDSQPYPDFKNKNIPNEELVIRLFKYLRIEDIERLFPKVS